MITGNYIRDPSPGTDGGREDAVRLMKNLVVLDPLFVSANYGARAKGLLNGADIIFDILTALGPTLYKKAAQVSNNAPMSGALFNYLTVA